VRALSTARAAAAARQTTRRYTHYSTAPPTHTPTRSQHSSECGYCSSSDYAARTNTHASGRRRQPCCCPACAEYIASYTTRLRRTDRSHCWLSLIPTRALSTCDLFLRFSDHGNAHCPSATASSHDTFELSELYSWIALHQLQPALEHPPTRPPYTASRLDSAASHTRTRPQEPARIDTHIIVWS
jgi:hypothetical protein